MTIVNWCKYDHKNLMERDPKWHGHESWFFFPCSMFIFHDFNSHVDCFKFNFKGLSNKVQLNSKTEVNIFVYMVDVSYGNWELAMALLNMNLIKQQATCKVANCNFTFWNLWAKETSNIELFCCMQPSFFVLFFIYSCVCCWVCIVLSTL